MPEIPPALQLQGGWFLLGRLDCTLLLKLQIRVLDARKRAEAYYCA